MESLINILMFFNHLHFDEKKIETLLTVTKVVACRCNTYLSMNVPCALQQPYHTCITLMMKFGILCQILDNRHPDSPVVVFSLLPHEQKMSVINIVLKKSPDVRRPIKSKDKLIFHIGCRRFSACPVFSQHTNGNKHKV